jgi:hypothetical protein
VDDFVLVQVEEGGNDLVQVVLHLHLGEPLPALDEFVEGLVGADLQQDVDVLVVLEDMLELHDVLVGQRFVDFDLGYQLRGGRCTFCLALDRLRELLAMILAAETRFVSRLVIS